MFALYRATQGVSVEFTRGFDEDQMSDVPASHFRANRSPRDASLTRSSIDKSLSASSTSLNPWSKSGFNHQNKLRLKTFAVVSFGSF